MRRRIVRVDTYIIDFGFDRIEFDHITIWTSDISNTIFEPKVNRFFSLGWRKIKGGTEANVLLVLGWEFEKRPWDFVCFRKSIFLNIMGIGSGNTGLNLDRIGPFILVVDNQRSLGTRCIELESRKTFGCHMSNHVFEMQE